MPRGGRWRGRPEGSVEPSASSARLDELGLWEPEFAALDDDVAAEGQDVLEARQEADVVAVFEVVGAGHPDLVGPRSEGVVAVLGCAEEEGGGARVLADAGDLAVGDDPGALVEFRLVVVLRGVDAAEDLLGGGGFGEEVEEHAEAGFDLVGGVGEEDAVDGDDDGVVVAASEVEFGLTHEAADVFGEEGEAGDAVGGDEVAFGEAEGGGGWPRGEGLGPSAVAAEEGGELREEGEEEDEEADGDEGGGGQADVRQGGEAEGEWGGEEAGWGAGGCEFLEVLGFAEACEEGGGDGVVGGEVEGAEPVVDGLGEAAAAEAEVAEAVEDEGVVGEESVGAAEVFGGAAEVVLEEGEESDEFEEFGGLAVEAEGPAGEFAGPCEAASADGPFEFPEEWVGPVDAEAHGSPRGV